MPSIALPFATWQSVIATLRADELPPYMAEHADRLERALDDHGPDEADVSISLTDDVFLRSYNWARLKLHIPLPPPEQ